MYKMFEDKRAVAFSTIAVIIGAIGLALLAFFLIKTIVPILQQLVPWVLVVGLIIGAIILWNALKTSDEPSFRRIRKTTGIRKSSN